MKVIVLGGAGGMAIGGISYLIRYDEVEEIMMADLNKEAADQAASQFNSPKIRTMSLNVLDKSRLIEVVKDYDVVLNCVGPFMKFGVPILEAVIEAGVNYVDICDDHDAAEELIKLDEKAQQAGVSALICMGTTPGISNLQAVDLYNKLDETHSIKIAWAITDPPKEDLVGTPLEAIIDNPDALMTEATMDHLYHVTTGDIPVFKDGEMTGVPAIEYGEWIDFAEPLGRAESYYIGHAEPTTLAHYLDIKDFCGCLGSIMPEVFKDIREKSRGHREALYPPKPSHEPLWQAPERWRNRGVWGGQAVIVEGMKDNQKIRYTSRIMMAVKDMNAYNNSGQAIGTYLMGTGQITRKGVSAPEACIDPEPFFKELAHNYSLDANEVFTVEEINIIDKEVLS